MICPVCGHDFEAVGRQQYCSGACRALAYRRRRDVKDDALPLPPARRVKPITVYGCAGCGSRSLGDQRCDECGTFMTRIGIGGHCPACDEPVAVAELIGPDS
ncbi:MAG: hypothetical protein DLM65_09660 [Candidatus Aeolococcus gillhamiae]|uniref:Uncharacterized protein n=1 Tax=Candidatus Aeolococcus gillhamiae TaxID=3127015 RepID=A0A2W6A8S7_9BACT|nr:MAG: hypothetical protein DLM65_09660 [Candidatus Dormibacter sp. RRmetagenome_bin12]